MAVIKPLPVEIPVPAAVQRLELDRVAPIDRDHGRQVAREVAVQRAPVEREVMRR
jgi:hypothetical protein